MAIVEVEGELKVLRTAKVRMDLAVLEYRRQLLRAVEATSENETAWALELSESDFRKQLAEARRVSLPEDGQHSTRPYEVCQRYAAGELSREEAMAQLIAWPYVPRGDMRTSPGDDLMFWPEGTTQDLFRAEHAGLIDDEMCYGVLDAVRARG